jgi:hypothetical protein
MNERNGSEFYITQNFMLFRSSITHKIKIKGGTSTYCSLYGTVVLIVLYDGVCCMVVFAAWWCPLIVLRCPLYGGLRCMKVFVVHVWWCSLHGGVRCIEVSVVMVSVVWWCPLYGGGC